MACEGTSSDAESASLEVTLSVDALLMDIELYCDGVAVDLSENDGSSSSSLGGVGWLPRYPCADGEVKLENTGNVDIEVSYYRGSTLYDAESLGQGSTITVADTTEDNQHWILELAGDNTIVDADRLTMGDNGRAYLIVETTNDQD